MNSKEIRKKFLAFFESKNHEVVSSAPMVVKDDPTLMFTNAGMNQFKDIFLGYSDVSSPRVVNSQKCLRVSGKHNDLEEVGVDTYHHTMFEMLGNWSFGDYFKKEAIEWAWEILTEVYKLDKNDIYVTVFEGDKKDGLGVDQEAFDIWKNIISEDRIILCDKTDNFWEMGETGPCGPCSELHIDLRSKEDKDQTPGKELVNKDHPQVIEIWNLVFMEYNRNSKGDLSPLPSKHIDTGMGFERLAVALQGKTSNYDTDIFQPLIQKIEGITGKKYGQSDSKQDIALRVISDHVRAVSFSIADGQLPSNNGAGYVIRRILRRAIRYSYSFLDMKSPFIHELVDILVEQMGDYFTELKSQQELISKVIHEEEESFLRTLEKGIHRLDEMFKDSNNGLLDGKKVFELYDTFGFPIDLTSLIAEEQNFKIDIEGFEKELSLQKERSRKDAKVTTGDWTLVREDEEEEFIGYDHVHSKIKITRYRKIESKGEDLYQIVFNLTPFYPEGGGQVGDIGRIFNDHESIQVIDTKKENNLIIHFTKELPEHIGFDFEAEVDSKVRGLSSNNHTATHLLHHVLREVLGTHVEQKGSLVNSKHLRFDFSHFSKVDDESLQKIEDGVNALIRRNSELQEYRAIPLTEAKEKGAMMLFGEKYGDIVRMIQFDDSKELCGGIHVNRTGDIGAFKIISESAVASGVRRIEAITAEKAMQHTQGELAILKEVKGLLKNPNDLTKAIKELQNHHSELQKEIEGFKKQQTQSIKENLSGEIETINGVNFICKKIDLDAGEIKNLAFQLKGEVDSLFALFGSGKDGKAILTCVVSENLIESKNLHAGNIIRELSKDIQGGGGGQAFFATAGGKNVDGIEKALKRRSLLSSDHLLF